MAEKQMYLGRDKAPDDKNLSWHLDFMCFTFVVIFYMGFSNALVSLGTKINSYNARWDCFKKKKNEFSVAGGIKWTNLSTDQFYWLD